MPSTVSSQKQLFDRPEGAVVRLPGTPGGAPLSKAQKLFNRLIERIQEQRDSLARWQEYVPKYQARLDAELEPLQQRCDQAQFALAKVFDAAHGSAGFTKRERAKLAMLISDTCAELLIDGESEDAAIVALHDRYSDTSHAELKDEEAEIFKDMAETIFGVELDDHEAAGSPEEVREALHRKMARQRESQPAPAPRRKSPKAQAKEAKLEADAMAATQSVREIFRKLASALHPDRETDAQERDRKTALMQQVNQAYAEKNLLRLLELQIQAEQIDAGSLASIAPSRLGHYNQVLTEQVAQLEHEVDAMIAPFAMRVGAFGREGLTPKTVDRSLDGDIAAMRRDAQRIEHDVKRLADRAALKAWLKHIKVQRRSDIDTAFDDLFDSFDETR